MKSLLKNWLYLNKKNNFFKEKYKRSSLVFFLFVLFSYTSNSQNLVPNGSFEFHTSCPNVDNQLYLASPWFSPTGSTTDLYDACSPTVNVPYSGGIYYSPIYAKNGNAYIGMIPWEGYREYAQVKLTSTLSLNACYYVEFYTILGQVTPYAINNMGANLSVNAYTNYPNGPTIQVPTHITRYNNPIIKDTINWTQVAGIYNATGGEEYITIGNFNLDQNTDSVHVLPTSPFGLATYYFIDAVSVYSLNPTGTLPWTYRDTIVTLGDSVYIGNYLGGIFNSNWYLLGGGFIKNGSGIYVKPNVTSEYIVQYTLCGVPRADTLKVTVNLNNGINKNSLIDWLKIFPNPANEKLFVESTFNFGKEFTRGEIVNSIGQLITVIDLNYSDKKVSIDLKNIPNGVYLFNLKGVNSQTISKRFVIAK